VNEDPDVDDLGFSPAISADGIDEVDNAPATSAAPTKRRRGLRRRLTGLLVLLCALGAMGGAYAGFASSSGAADAAGGSASVDSGRQLFEVSCITCHGANLQGVTDRGPSLIGVGSASVYFQVSTGRMPATAQGAENLRKVAKFNEQQTDDLAAYVQSIGGGPVIPSGNLTANANIADGGELFRLNCASCHGTTGKGAPLSAGAVAPGLNEATEKQIAAAMLTGPENMPVFSNNQITPQQKSDIIAFVKNLQQQADPGGAGLDRIGPVSEGIVIWVAGIGVVLLAILWIGVKS
jgi:ubiquinol-cytochrome c reductase cytochrome c subunit